MYRLAGVLRRDPDTLGKRRLIVRRQAETGLADPSAHCPTDDRRSRSSDEENKIHGAVTAVVNAPGMNLAQINQPWCTSSWVHRPVHRR